MGSSKLWSVAAVVAGLAVGGCSGGSPSAPVASVGRSADSAGGAGSSSVAGATPLARALAYARCMRSHGMAQFPDPVQTPSGGYGFRTTEIDPHSAAFQSASTTCEALVPGGWGDTGRRLSPAQQQAWLDWAACVRANGVADFADPTFAGGEVRISGAGPGSSP
ncbi:MAG TPA: hypothetical protein VE990_01630, partial [Acidimicrobiales bacterium]|nr:hypothetical protein [Acidimicrobiales bacterium]